MVKFTDEQIAKLGKKLREDFSRPGEHATDQQLLDYTLGNMSEVEKDRLDVHLVACGSCTEAVALMVEAAEEWDAGAGERVLAKFPPALTHSAAASASSPKELIKQLVESFRAAIERVITADRVQYAYTFAPYSKWQEGVAAGDITYTCRRGEDAIEFYFYAPDEEFINTSYTIKMGSDARQNWMWQGETTFIKCQTVPGAKASAYLPIDREERLDWPDDARVIELMPKQQE